MEDEKQRTVLPTAIYFDTNSLYQMGPTFDASWIRELGAFAVKVGIELCVPELALKEWVGHLEQEYQKRLNRLRGDLGVMADQMGWEKPALEARYEGVNASMIADVQRKRLAAAGFSIVPIHCPDLQQLIDEAISRIAPFEHGDKGFRDTIIAESVIHHATSRTSGAEIVLATSDAVFSKSLGRFRRDSITCTVLKPDEVMPHLQKGYINAIWDLRHEEERRAIEFLNKHRDEIFRAVRSAKVSLWHLQSNGLQPDETLRDASIEAIRAARPIEISSARLGTRFPESENPPPDRCALDFNVSVEFDVTIKRLSWLSDYTRTLIPLSGTGTVDTIAERPPPSETKLDDVTLTRRIYVQADIPAEDAEKSEYHDLRITRIF